MTRLRWANGVCDTFFRCTFSDGRGACNTTVYFCHRVPTAPVKASWISFVRYDSQFFFPLLKFLRDGVDLDIRNASAIGQWLECPFM